MLSIEEVDLLVIANALRARFGSTLEEGYLDGRTILRDAVAAHLRCSELEAEDLVETLQSNGYLRFPELSDTTHSRRAGCWLILDHD